MTTVTLHTSAGIRHITGREAVLAAAACHRAASWGLAEQIAALGKDIPDFKPGDTVRVGYKVTEGTRTRVQNYEGVVISRKHG